MSETDTSPELRVGQYGLRTFHVSEDGYLLPVNAMVHDSRLINTSWKNGTCIAQCAMERNHPVPDDGCTCGIYSFPTVDQVRRQYPSGYTLLAVVSLEGRVIEGERGWRSEAARIVALWMPRAARLYPSDLGRITKQLTTNYPGIEFHENLDTMIDTYEGVSHWDPATWDPALWDLRTGGWARTPSRRDPAVLQEGPSAIDKPVVGKVARGVTYLSLAIQPLQLALLAVVTFVATRYAPATSAPGYAWHTFLSHGIQDWGTYLSNGMLALHQAQLYIAAHPVTVTIIGGILQMPMPVNPRPWGQVIGGGIPVTAVTPRPWRWRWRRSLRSVLLGTTSILSLEAVCVVVALTARSSVGWLDFVIGVVCVAGIIPLMVFIPAVSDRVEREMIVMRTSRSPGLVQTGVRIGTVWPPA